MSRCIFLHQEPSSFPNPGAACSNHAGGIVKSRSMARWVASLVGARDEFELEMILDEEACTRAGSSSISA
jgi:hypothetical protein